jgi:Hsp70 protein
VNDVKPAPTGDAQEVKVKVRINHNGVLLISSAQMIEKKDVQEDQQNGANETEQPQSPTDPSPTSDAAPAAANEPMDTQEVSTSFCPFVITFRVDLKKLPSPCITTHNHTLCLSSVEDDHPADLIRF